MAHLFISYARRDRAVVEALVPTLEVLGHEPFYDSEMSAGTQWWQTLLDKIEVSQGFIPVLSDEYLQSEACHREAEWATALGIPMLPIDIEGVRPELCARQIANSNWVQYSADDPMAVARIARGLAELPPFELPDPMPERPEIPISYFADLERLIRTAWEIPFEQELSLVATLTAKLQAPREAATARELLIALGNRPDVTYSSKVAIDAALGASEHPAAPPTDPPRRPDGRTPRAKRRRT